MKHSITTCVLVAALLAVSTAAVAATAFWTGQSRPGTSVTGAPVMNCEYNYAGKTFWRAFVGLCPSSIEIQ